MCKPAPGYHEKFIRIYNFVTFCSALVAILYLTFCIQSINLIPAKRTASGFLTICFMSSLFRPHGSAYFSFKSKSVSQRRSPSLQQFLEFTLSVWSRHVLVESAGETIGQGNGSYVRGAIPFFHSGHASSPRTVPTWSLS